MGWWRPNPWGLRADEEPLKTVLRTPVRKAKLVGLFAGMGGFERGFHAAGHHTLGVAEINPFAGRVLATRFPNTPNYQDVREIKRLRPGTEVVCAGWPCTDLSSLGKKVGLYGEYSSLAFELLRILTEQRVPVIVLENVMQMLSARGDTEDSPPGAGMTDLMGRFTALGYRWAYRLVDARSFGYNQRRKRVLWVMSNDSYIDPRQVLFADNAPEPSMAVAERRHALPFGHWRKVPFAFQWTYGQKGAGWGMNVIPPLVVGSGVNIPSPPAIVLRSGKIILPDIRDAEALQGFPTDWTLPAVGVPEYGVVGTGKKAFIVPAGTPGSAFKKTTPSAARGARWKLVGNAIPVRMAAWIGLRLRRPAEYDWEKDLRHPVKPGRSWPKAGWGGPGPGGKMVAYEARGITQWPFGMRLKPLDQVLQYPGTPLSPKATRGFLDRLRKGRLRRPPGFEQLLEAHIARMERGGYDG